MDNGTDDTMTTTAPAQLSRWVRICVTVLVLALSAVYLYSHRPELTLLSQVGATDLLALCLCIVLSFVLSAATFAVLVSLVGVRIAPLEAFGLSLLTNFGNYLGPARPGAALKAVYLKRTKGLAYVHFASVLAANACLLSLMTGIAGLAGLAWQASRGTATPPVLIVTCAAFVLAAVVPFVVPAPTLRNRTGRIARLIRTAIEGFGIIRSRRFGMFKVCVLLCAQFLVAAICYQVAFSVLGFTLAFRSALVIGVFTSMMNFFTITPNNLGLQEALTAYLFAVTGFDFSAGVIGAGLVRVIHILITFGLTPIFVHMMQRPTNLSAAQLVGWRAQDA